MDATRVRFVGCTESLCFETLASRHQIFAPRKTFLTTTTRRKPLNSSTFISYSSAGSRFRVCAERSQFQDFQGYAKPSYLIKANEIEVCTKPSVEKILSSLKGDDSQALFKVDITTSKLYGSNLSDLTAGILLCLIDEKGNSILQRIPANLMIDHLTEKHVLHEPEIFSFQRGSFDEFIFKGPKMGRLEAIWLSVESGQWRVGSLSLSVISWSRPSIEKTDGEVLEYMGLRFDFPDENVLLGEGSDNSMVELKPCLVTELSGVDALTILNKGSSHSNLVATDIISNVESMKEYADLKLSLLLYDAILIFIGTSVAFFTVGESAGFACLVGGVLGFLYLLLLQRSVDELPAPTVTFEATGNEDQPFGQYKGPLLALALAIGFAFFAVQYNLRDSVVIVTPKEIVMGMLGFLACKIAAVLAAVKPMAFGQKVNE